MRTTTKAKIGLAGLGATALTLAATLPAFADYAPGPSDIVGVGGDTPQFDLAFGADGDATKGVVGFNSSHPVNRLVPFLATADGNARAAYDQNGNLLNPTVVLRAGKTPVQRVPSSGAAITALLADTGKTHVINFVFSASLPTSAQQVTAASNGWTFLHSVEIGKDAVVVAKDTTSDAPASLSIADLLKIYDGTATKWSDLGGASGATIIPELPPKSSSIYKTFIADLTTANSGTAPSLANPNIITVQQNDTSAITGAARPADAILPFSSARLTLDKSGYFLDPTLPTAVFPGTTGVKPAVVASAGYSSTVLHYVIFRQSDIASKTPMEPGSSLNWVNTLFSKSTVKGAPLPYFDTAAGKADVAAAGTTPVYDDLGNKSSG